MNSLTILIFAMCVLVLAYRYYSAFLSAKVAVLDAKKKTPAYEFRDGKDYHPTNKWVLFGHHFAAIAGAGPLVGPVLAAQYGYLPGALWILVGSVFAGAVQDYIILYASVRNRGESISKIAHRYLGPVAGWCTAFAVLFIIIVALAGLAMVVVNALSESAWGVFTIGCSIPIAFLMGQWMYRIRPGKITEATVIGVVLLVGAVLAGHPVQNSSFGDWLRMTPDALKVALPVYGFIAAVLPVWMLLCPRDYLSTYMKLGTIALLALGVFIVHPNLRMPATTQFMHGGPIIPGPVWPYVCLTIACGAISGFHSLIGSGTTPKMISSEADIRPIGYGAMLAEAFVGLLALVAACILPPDHYFAINTAKHAWVVTPGVADQMGKMAAEVGEKTLLHRQGGAVSLAVGMSGLFKKIPGMGGLVAYWYHFAIMFEALFILTTVDTGTRVARFIVQEMLSPIYKPLGKGTWIPGVIITSGLVTYAWYYLIKGGSVSSIWPMFGIANQLLGVIALAIGTTYILRRAPKRAYALTTFLPFLFMAVTVLYSGADWTRATVTKTGTLSAVVSSSAPQAKLVEIAQKLPTWKDGSQPLPVIKTAVTNNYVCAVLTVIMMILAVVICMGCAAKWITILRCPKCPSDEQDPDRDLMRLAEGTDISD